MPVHESLPANLPNFKPKAFYKELGVDGLKAGFEYRLNQIQTIGFPIITKENFDRILKVVKGKKVLDVGAGGCFLGEALKGRGIDVTTLDLKSYRDIEPSNVSGYSFITPYEPDILGDIHKIDTKPYNAFIVNWPDYESEVATTVLKALGSGDILIYIGEGSGGCCASDNYFDLFFSMMLRGEMTEDDSLNFEMRNDSVSYYGIHDRFSVYKRR